MFLSGGGGNSFECALSKGGSFKCVQNACRGREGVKKGQKTACALYGRPLMAQDILRVSLVGIM